VAGTAFECGEQLGWAWVHALKLAAERVQAGSRPWWSVRSGPVSRLMRRHAPHLPDLFCGMARGAGLPMEKVGTRLPGKPEEGCTSFAAAPRFTLDGTPISGQTKDTPDNRITRYQVLRMRMTDAPAALTLTYPGWLYGHGFVQGRCAIFRNSLYAGEHAGLLPYSVWGLLALHCASVEEVASLTREHGVDRTGFHATVADAQGCILGIECGRGGVGVCRPRRGLYVHANAVRSGKRLLKYDTGGEYGREDSLHREERLRARLEPEAGRLTSQLAFQAMTDHDGFPDSVCRHRAGINTTAAVVAEPVQGLLHVCRGHPCRNWARRYRL
jgi:isopenicillin-N N-acyltransferase-like protein